MKKILLLALIYTIVWITESSAQSTSFMDAFESFHNTLSIQYAFTDWKGINWDELYTEFQSRVTAAEAANDSSTFYLAIREYLYSIPDGHVELITAESRITGWGNIKDELMYSQIGGSYGFALIGLDDGRVVVRHITEGSSADSADIRFGAEIFEVNNTPIEEALSSVSILWAENIPATKEGQRLQQYRFIGRAPVGNSLLVKFRNRGESNINNATLYATDDDYFTYILTTMSTGRDTLPFVSSKILQPYGYGYIKLTSCGNPDMVFDIYNEFKDAIRNFISNNTPGIILDLRQNEGGEDNLAASIAGFFYSDTSFYEAVSCYSEESEEFEILLWPVEHINSITNDVYVNHAYPLGTVYIEPPDLRYHGKIIVLTGPRNISSGEGVAMALQKLPNCDVIGLYGSHGSFGIVIPDFAVWLDSNMDNPLIALFTIGRSLNENGNIQIDSDENMHGGVIPDIRLPLDENAIDKMFLYNIDYELECAIDYLHRAVGLKGEEKIMIPNEFVLYQNYPNPFNPTTTINYSVPSNSFVSLNVFDMLGRKVAVLVHEYKRSGQYNVEFNASNLSSGFYIYKIKTDSFEASKKLIILK